MSWCSRCWVVVLLLPLFGCGPGRNAFAPACPTARLVPSLADLTRYDNDGMRHDVANLVLQGRVMAVNGKCRAGDTDSVENADVTVAVEMRRGPGMHGRTAEVPVFLAVLAGQQVLDKQVFPVHVVFPSNVDSLLVTSPPITLALPVGKGRTGASYTVIAGFQLTPAELEANRHANGG